MREAGSYHVWVLTYDLPSDSQHRRDVGRFYRLLARLRRRYPHLIEGPTLSTLILKTDTLANTVVRAILRAEGRYTINKSISLKPMGLDVYIPQKQ
ncbi:hypothetical protein DRO54_10785 [Candidatus Bathyarchaeota archaeon]|nr:MAG: hypothetical protein DRO54_10785 [Candidatus Bathyarchaeota archaeon]